jgi:CDP-paratose synthetase
MNILVTGATGFIGKSLVPLLQRKGHSVRALIRPTTQTCPLEQLHVPYILDDGTQELEKLLKQHGHFDGIIHLSSLFLPSHKSVDISPLLTTNILFPTRLLEAAVRTHISWFINTGTIWQHYENKDYSPVNLYAATKQAFESLAQYYIEAHGIRFVTLALSDTYGPGDTREKLLNLWCRIAKTGETLDMSEGQQKIDLVYVDDVADAFAQTVDNISSHDLNKPTYSVSSGNVVSLRELAILFEETTGRSLNINWGRRPARLREMMTPWKSSVGVPGWQPKMSMQEGILNLWQAFMKKETKLT